MTQQPNDRLLPCPAGHDSSRVIGGPGTAGGPKYWAGCDYCNWRAWGNTEAEAIAAWNRRTLPLSTDAEMVSREWAERVVAEHIEEWGWGPLEEIEGLSEHKLAVDAVQAGAKAAIAALPGVGVVEENARLREVLEAARFWFAGYVANGGKGADEELAAIREAISKPAIREEG